jgi:hypothetical protein
LSQVDLELYALRPWYHDFSSLGFDTAFLGVPFPLEERARLACEATRAVLMRLLGGRRTTPVPRERPRSIRDVLRRAPTSHLLNQPVKERHLMRLVARALSGLGPGPDCLELPSADGYYSCRIKALSPRARVTGVELDPGQVRRAETITRRLAFRDVTFHQADVWSFVGRPNRAYDLVLCAGGLYHVSDPARLLQAGKPIVRGYLVVQSVVTLETEDPGHFVQPASGWQHGCRFTHAWLRARLEDLGWRVLEEARAELPGNPGPTIEGRASSCARTGPSAPRLAPRLETTPRGPGAPEPSRAGTGRVLRRGVTLRMTIAGQRPAVGHWSTVHGRIPHNRETVDSCRTKQAGMLALHPAPGWSARRPHSAANHRGGSWAGRRVDPVSHPDEGWLA